MAAVSRYRVAAVLFRRRNKLAAGRFVLVGGSGRAEGFRSRSVLVRSLSHPPRLGVVNGRQRTLRFVLHYPVDVGDSYPG